LKIGNSGDNFNFAFAGGFGAANTMMQKDGKVSFGPMLPEFKQYLTTASTWYKEGLIDTDFPTANPFDFANWWSDKTGYQFGFANVATAAEAGGQTTDPDYNAIGVPSPVVNKGDNSKFGLVAEDVYSGSVITTQSEKVEICARWMDYLYSDEGAVAVGFGKEGETFFFDEDGNPTVDAAAIEKMYSAPFASLQMVLGPVNGPFYSIKWNGYGLKKASAGMNMSYLEAGKTWMKDDTSALIPSFVTMTADEATEYYSKINDINTLTNESIVKIITGAEPVESFDKTLQTLKDMGIDRCVVIQQAALDRYNSR
jgi:putative aldouronate transport system substrate-binding protein